MLCVGFALFLSYNKTCTKVLSLDDEGAIFVVWSFVVVSAIRLCKTRYIYPSARALRTFSSDPKLHLHLLLGPAKCCQKGQDQESACFMLPDVFPTYLLPLVYCLIVIIGQ